MMQVAPFTSDDLAVARHVLTHAQNLQALDPADQGEILGMAWSILKQAQSLRQDATPAPRVPARVYPVPLAVFQAGRKQTRPTHHLQLAWPHPSTPGDAA